MDEELRAQLLFYETDLDGALNRFAGDGDLYVHCLSAFLDDPTIRELKEAIAQEKWNDAFTAAHALKGMAANMGFVPLFHAAAHTVVLLRAGKIEELTPSLTEIDRQYRKIADVIHIYLN